MTIAAVIPNWNNGPWLERALKSVFSQTVAVEEVIVVDGRSTDSSREVASRFPVRWMDAERKGQADARNVGIRATACDLILPLDSDDWIEPAYVERCLPKFEDLKVGVAAPGLRWPDGRIQWPVPPFTVEALRTGNRLFCCSMFRRRCWEEVGGYSTAKTYEDLLLWLEIAARGWKIEMVMEPLFHYCPHDRGSTARMESGAHQRYVEHVQRRAGELIGI